MLLVTLLKKVAELIMNEAELIIPEYKKWLIIIQCEIKKIKKNRRFLGVNT